MTFPFTKTKTLCTLGPSSDSSERITELIHTGMDGIRLNFSHGSHDYFKMVFDNIYKATVETSAPISVLIDLQGPKIRIGELETESIPLISGETVEVAAGKGKGNKNILYASYEHIVTDATVGDKIFIDDGYIKLEVIGKTDSTLRCVII